MKSDTPNADSPNPKGRFQFSLGNLFLLMVTVAMLAAVVRYTHVGDHSKPSKALVHDVFRIGMNSDEALGRLPPGHSLAELSIIHEYATPGPTRAQLANDEYFGIVDRESAGVPLFFNHSKRLVRVGPEFDEEKYVSLFQESTHPDRDARR